MISAIKTIDGHLTQTRKEHIKHLLNNGYNSGKIGRFNYSINETDKDHILQVVISTMDRGLIPCGGSPLRMSHYKYLIEVN